MEHLAKKYGPAVVAKFSAPGNPLDVAGRKVGIAFNSQRRVIPTLAAHRVAEWVGSKPETKGKQDSLMEEMFKMYFEEGKDLSKVSELGACVERVGGIGSAEECRKMLEESTDFVDSVRKEDDEWKRKRVSGVPFFIIGEGKSAVQLSGGQPKEVFAEVLDDLMSD